MKFAVKFTTIGLLLASYFAAVNTFFGNANAWLDKNCHVDINITLWTKDIQAKDLENRQTFQKCYNNTFLNMDRRRNFTGFEVMSCKNKCFQITYGEANVDGSMNPKISELVKEKYEKYTNATPSYINKIVNILTASVNEAVNKVKMQQANRTKVSACAVNGYYSVYRTRVFQSQFKNYRNITRADRIQVCGDQIGAPGQTV